MIKTAAVMMKIHHAQCLPLDGMRVITAVVKPARRVAMISRRIVRLAARAQGPHVSGMIAVHIVTVHICKGLLAFWIHAFVCYNSSMLWRIFCTETECH